MEEYRLRQPARDPEAVRRWHADNRAAWNQGAARYTEALQRTIDRLRAGESNLHPVERENLGDLSTFRRAVHLQCASGFDTMSLLLEGIEEVVGIDISDVHIDNARRIGEAVGANATWYRCDVLDTPAELDGTADLVYTGRGAINWIADLDGWAAVCARLARPGGVVHLFEGHPFMWLLDENDGRLEQNEIDYFTGAVSSRGWPDAYIGDLEMPDAELATMHERSWPLSEVAMALLRAGLVLERIGEHPVDYWESLPAIPAAVRSRLPLTMSIMARKP